MKKTMLFLLCALFLAHFSCSSRKEQITARIDGWGNDTVIVQYYDFSSEQEGVDTVLARNGRFGYTPPVEGLVQALFYRKADLYSRSGSDYLPGSRMIEVAATSGNV